MENIPVQQKILSRNDEIAASLRQVFDRQGVYVINLISSPGSGKTSLLERILPVLGPRFRCGVIEGDVQTENDARRIARLGFPVHQIITCGACHLDAQMISDHLDRLPVSDLDFLCIENVGNLVCPSSYWLGEDAKIVILSAAEGDDKPVKYPAVFRRAAAMVVNKTDLAQWSDFSQETAIANARGINPGIEVFPLSCRTGEGLLLFTDWLSGRISAKKA